MFRDHERFKRPGIPYTLNPKFLTWAWGWVHELGLWHVSGSSAHNRYTGIQKSTMVETVTMTILRKFMILTIPSFRIRITVVRLRITIRSKYC